MCKKRDDLDLQIMQCRIELSKIGPTILVQSIRSKIQELNSKLFIYLHQIKTQKRQNLLGPPITNSQPHENNNTVITIQADLPLSDPEKSLLSKGLNFVPIAKFLRRVQLKAFFHNKEDISRTSEKDIFETINVRKSKWTPPEGQFTSVDFFVQKCRYDIQKLKFNRFTKCSNLSTEE